MKKISLVLCFALMLVLVFAFNVFAATKKDITDDARFEQDGSTSDLLDLSKVIDGDYTTASSCGNAGENWVNYRFYYDEGTTVSKVFVVLNSTGTVSNGKVYESVSENNYTFYIRLYTKNGNNYTAVYNTEYKSGTNYTEVKDVNNNVLYTYFEIVFDKPYTGIYEVEVPVVNNKNPDVGLWEVEIYTDICDESGHAGPWTDATCSTLSTCTACGATTGELAPDNHVWKDATCSAPKTCKGCGATDGDPLPHKNILENGNCTVDDKCRACGVVIIEASEHNFDRNGYCTNERCYYRNIENNIAKDKDATITTSPDGWWACKPQYIVDGNWDTSSHAPKSSTFSYIFTYSTSKNFSRFVVATNGLSYAPAAGNENNNNAIMGVKVVLKDANGAEVYTTAAYGINGAEEVEIVLPYPMVATSVTFTFTSSQQYGSSFVREIEIYEPQIEGCDVHNFEIVNGEEATCTAEGTYSVVCSTCKAVESVHVIPATGHDIADKYETIYNDCTSAPVLQYACTVCGETVESDINVDDIIDRADKTSILTQNSGGGTTASTMFDGSFETWTVGGSNWAVEGSINFDRPYYLTSVTVWLEGSSINAGLIVYYQAPGSETWERCNESAMIVYAPWGEISEFTLEIAEPVYASAIKIYVGDPDGTPQGGGPGLASYNGRFYEAKVTGAIENVAPKGHTWDSGVVVDPTCVGYGYKLYNCSECDATMKAEYVKELGHAWAAATCVAPKTCTRCDATEGDVDANAHLYDDNANDATCNREGCDYVRGIARIGDQYFATLADAFNTAVEGDEIVVLDKIVVEGEATWNLTGKTITFVNSPADNYAVVVKGDLTIVGGTYNVTGYFGFGVTGKLTVKGGTFVAETADYLIGSWGTTTINGGSFKANYNCVNAFAGSVVINGGNFEVIDVNNTEWPAQDVFGEGVGTAVIYGGTFSTDIYAYLAETYHIDLDENGKYVAAPTIHVDAKAATCTTNGNVEYWYCETCELVWVDKALTRISNFKSVVTPAAHAESVIQVVTKPTCTDPGEQENICSVCGEVVSTETIAPVAHTVEYVAEKAATCETEGNVEYWYCTVCGAAWTDEACTKVTNLKSVITPAAHTVEYVAAKEATCFEQGNVQYWYCTVCEIVWADEAQMQVTNFKNVIIPITHNVEHVDAKAATCYEPGNIEYWYCTDCGSAWTDELLREVTNLKNVVLPIVHNVEHVAAKAATCYEPGNIEYWYCKDCGSAWTDELLREVTNLKNVVLPIVHNVEHVEAKAATCYEPGNIEYWYCTDCGSAWTDELLREVTNLKNVILPIVHNIEHVAAKAATCTENGNIEYWYCSDCGYAWLDEACTLNTNLKAVVLPMAEHDYWQLDWSADMKQPTCIEEGYETYKCDCGATKVFYYEPDTVDGHDWVINQETFVKATCIADGYRERKCSLCNAEEAGALDKDIYGDHIYVTDEKPATCQEDGYTKTTCELCDYLNIEPIPANDWSHDYNYSANGIFKECAICGDWGLRDTIKGGNEEAVADYSIYFMGSDVINIYHTEDYSILDEFYHYTIAKNEDGTYTLTIADCYNGNDTFKLANTTAKFEIVENGGILTFTNADGVVYTFDNIPEEEPITLNYETYAYYDSMDPTGETINFKVTFVGGYAYILVNTMFEGLSEKFWIEYNPDYGMIDTEIGTFFSISNNTLYLPRGTELTRVDFEMPEIEEPEVNYGDKIGSITVETTDTYGYFDLYSYTSTAAGKYSFFVPAGLGFYSKALFDTYAEAEVGFYDNEAGDYVSFDLAAGETIEFYVGSLVKDTWTIDVYYYTDAPAHVHKEVAIDAILPTPSTIGYTAGIKCSECGEIIKAPVEIKITQTDIVDQFRIDAISLEAKENIAVNYKTYAKAGYNNPYIVFVFNGNEYMMLEPTKIDGDGRLVFKFDQTFPQLMQDNIEAYFYAETAVGEYAMDSVQEYSVLTYILKQLKKNDAALTTVMSDILYMGAKTQIFMNYKTDALVTDLAVAQGYTLTPTAFTEIPSSANITKVTGDRTTGTDWYSTSLAMGASTEAILKFQTDDASNLKIKIAFEGKIYTYNASELKTEVTEDGLVYLIYFDQVKSFEYDKVITATFERDGEQVGSTITYSINSFLARNYNKSSQPANAKELMKALYTYGVSSAAYFG